MVAESFRSAVVAGLFSGGLGGHCTRRHMCTLFVVAHDRGAGCKDGSSINELISIRIALIIVISYYFIVANKIREDD